MTKVSKLLLAVVLSFSSLTSFAQDKSDIYKDGWIDMNKNGKKDVYEDKSKSNDERIKDLMGQMTLDEKVMQVTTLYGYGRILQDERPTEEWKTRVWKDGIGNIDEHVNAYSNKFGIFNESSFPYSEHAKTTNLVQKWFLEETRLGIPVDFTNEAMYGVKHEKSTMVAGPICRASAWDRDLEYRVGTMYAKEARALGYDNIYAPMLDVARLANWARVAQTYGEDPYLVSQMGLQMVNGLQDHNVASTPKHFLGYSVVMGGRDGNSRVDPQIPLRDYWNLIAEPWRVAVVEGKLMGLMITYADYDGEPIIDSDYWMNRMLREQWGFKGYTVSDSDALEYLDKKHMTASSYPDGIARAFKAGLNMRTTFTVPEQFTEAMHKALDQKLLTEEELDVRVAEVLDVKFRLGLFDEPLVADEMAADKIVKSEEHKALALETSRKAMVLLKNYRRTLPFHKDEYKSIALIGALADNKKDMNPTMYSGYNQDPITVKEGLEKVIKDLGVDIKINYAKGVDVTDAHFPESDVMDFPLTSKEEKEIEEAIEAAKKSEVVVMVVGDNLKSQGESQSRVELKLPGHQQKMLQAVHDAVPNKNFILVLMSGRAVQLNWADKNCQSILEAWIAGEYAGQAIAETLFGINAPSGKTPVTFPKHVGQIVQAFPRKPGADGDGHARVNGDLYPFGHGLAYTHFEYKNMKVVKKEVDGQEIFEVSAKIRNAGWRDGTEIVQLYVRDELSSVTTYELNLKGFERVDLKRGETKEVKFTVRPVDLALYNREYKFVTEKGEFTISLGASSQDIRLKKRVSIDKDYTDFDKSHNYFERLVK
ncbi:MAG: glycoside hydrolase family 3 N-terminal domain-containing protein [Bacteroidota bacterium]